MKETSHTIKWYQIEPKQLEIHLSTDFTKGLSSKRVQDVQIRYGKNIITKKKDLGLFGRFLKQFKNPLVIILLIAGIITIFLNEFVNSTVIFLAMFVNVVIGTLQEEKANRAFDKLNKLQQKYATVIRDGKRKVIESKEITLGDIVIIESGMSIPADIRILESNDLEVNESVLTGEWVSVKKYSETIKKNVPINEQNNMVWMSTLVSSGHGVGLVVEIGNNTQLGDITKSLSEGSEIKTTIQKNIKKLTIFISYIAIILIAVILVLGVLKDQPLMDILLLSLAIAVSIVPEGLPAAMTVVLAIGMEKILKAGGLVKNILTAETLGSTTTILTDKTGTLTEAKMKATDLITLDFLQKNESKENIELSQKKLLKMAVLSSDAFIEEKENGEEEIIIHGRPAEKAIVLEGLERGISQRELDEKNNRVDFYAFNSENGFASSLNECTEISQNRIYFSGSPESLLNQSTFVLEKDNIESFSDERKNLFINKQKKKSREGVRFIGIAYKDTGFKKIPRDGNLVDKKEIKDLVFVGIIGLSDPVRSDVKTYMKEAKSAGTRIIMLTGDNQETALKIAKDSGIVEKDERVILGVEIEKYNDEELLKILKENNIFARVLPSQKLRIVKILRNDGEIVAMTGDGINDAPALQNADIGIAVGSGTEVAKEASDLILLNDSFSIIIKAIEEGRRIIDNLKKIILHLTSVNFGEVFLIMGSLVFAAPLPILPAQILWINIIGEGILNFSFAFEPAEKDIMKRNPNLHNSNSLISPDIKKMIFATGIITGLFTLLLFVALKSIQVPIEELRTIMFITLSLDSILFSFSIKNLKKPIWKINLFSNTFLNSALVISILALSGVFLIPFLRDLLQLTILNRFDLAVILLVAIFNLFTIELAKYFIFWRKTGKSDIFNIWKRYSQ
ncbi:MAG: HAD-IC family P-type ATPase [Candidatus Paceibacterota bacterium]